MKRLIFFVGLLLAPLHAALAWDQEGHSIVAELAQRRLSPAALASVKQILGGEISLASIASWADEVRDQRPETYNWHFVDIPLSQTTYDANLYCRDVGGKGDCAINAIERSRTTLADGTASNEQRAEALKFLVHFVGDLHHPLHTVGDNRGENGLVVSFFTDPTGRKRDTTNLHAVWDSGLIRNQFWAWGAYVQWIESNWLPGKDVAQLSAGTPVDWALEAHRIAIDYACAGISPNAALDQAYVKLVRPQLDRQLAVGGLRLARLLNETLKDNK